MGEKKKREHFSTRTEESLCVTAISSHRPMILVIVASVLILMGGIVAYAQGQSTKCFFSGSNKPQADIQFEFVENYDQKLEEVHSINGWTIELKSTMFDGETGYILFGITAPEDINLEWYHSQEKEPFALHITPGNNSWNPEKRRSLIVASIGSVNDDMNYIYQDGGYWTADNDRSSYTLDYVVTIRCEKLYPHREMLLKNPFGPDVEFNIRFIDFKLDSKDYDVQKTIEEQHAGEDYIVEADGLFKSELLVEGQWEFNVIFANTSDNMELNVSST